MRSQNINYNSAGTAGKISCFLLLLLAFLVINPITHHVHAEEVADTPAPLADNNRLEISLTPVEVSGEMTPTTEAGLKKQLEAKAKIIIQNAENYSIYIGAETTALKGVKTGETVNSITTATNYDDLPANSWGIYWGEGEAIPENALYRPAENGQGASIVSDGGKVTAALEKNYALGFAANINSKMPADTYQNKVTLSVVSSPLEIASDFGISAMQEMTAAVCTSATDVDGDGQISAQLEDTRDGKYYWVSKLADGKCWMTQNLDLDLKKTTKLTTADSDVPTAGYIPAYDTAEIVDSSTILADSTGQRSWSLGNVRIINPDTSSDCGGNKGSAADCPKQFTAHTTPKSRNSDGLAHYILGNHYQWNTATAGTGNKIMSGTATNSICPKGWKLPTSAEYATLVEKLGGASKTDNITKTPFYGVRGGFVYQDTSSLFRNAGTEGYYWSSTPYSNGSSAYNLAFRSTNTVNPSDVSGRDVGYSVRCVAR